MDLNREEPVDPVLLLNADHSPIRTLSWQRAVELVLDGRVNVVASNPDAAIRSEQHPSS